MGRRYYYENGIYASQKPENIDPVPWRHRYEGEYKQGAWQKPYPRHFSEFYVDPWGNVLHNPGPPRGKSLRLCDRVRGGYKVMTFFQDMKYLHVSQHIMIARCFVFNPRPDLFDLVDHIDRDKHNNVYTNLRWVNTHLNRLNVIDKTKVKPKSNGMYYCRMCFCRKTWTLGWRKTVEEYNATKTNVRFQLFDLLYDYHTRPMTYAVPERWILTRDERVITCPEPSEDD